MLTNIHFTFEQMAERYGEPLAWQYLAEIEKASGIRPQQNYGSSPEDRIARAFWTQDCVTEFAIAM